MQLVFSRSWKLERIVPPSHPCSTPPVYRIFFFLSILHAAPLFPWNSPSFSRPPLSLPPAHAIPIHICAVLYELHFSLLSSSCRLFGRESAKKRTYLSRLLIVSGLTREAEGKTRWLLFEIERENLIVAKGDCRGLYLLCMHVLSSVHLVGSALSELVN